LCLAAFLLILIGTNTQAGWLFVLASMVIGALITGVFLPIFMVRGLAIERIAPTEAFAGENVPVTLVVRNLKRRTLLLLSITDPHIARTTAFIPTLGKHEEVRAVTTRHAARRGVVDGAPVVVSSSAPFGMATVRRTIPAAGRTIIYPRVVKVDWVPEIASAMKPLDASHIRARKGAGMEFVSVREYHPGDSLRHIHWPTSARVGELMVREFEQELPRRLGVYIDASADNLLASRRERRRDRGRPASELVREGDNESVLDAACAVAASLGAYAVREGHPSAFAGGGAGGAGPRGGGGGAGTGGLLHLDDPNLADAYTWLAGLQPGGGVPPVLSLPAARSLLGRLDTLVLVLPTWRTSSATALTPALLDLGGDSSVELVAVLVEANSYLEGGATGGGAAKPLSVAETDELAGVLQAAGAFVYRVRRGEDLAVCLSQPTAA